MKIIPAIDIIDGKCVRLTTGDYRKKKIYNNNPLDVAKEFEGNGIKYLHLVDLDGAKYGRIINHKILESIARETSLKIDFGGGIATDSDIELAFEYGANQVTGGSVAVHNPDLFNSWLNKYGPEKLILGADSKNRKIRTDGWTSCSNLDVIEFIENYKSRGISTVICTDIDKDGMLNGPSTKLYREIISATGIDLVASGGISSIEDIKMLQEIGCSGVIIGKAIYENRIAIKYLGDIC